MFSLRSRLLSSSVIPDDRIPRGGAIDPFLHPSPYLDMGVVVASRPTRLSTASHMFAFASALAGMTTVH